MDVCVCITNSLWCTPETNTKSQVNYTPIKNKNNSGKIKENKKIKKNIQNDKKKTTTTTKNRFTDIENKLVGKGITSRGRDYQWEGIKQE